MEEEQELVIKAEIFKIIRANMDKRPKQILSLVKLSFPRLEDKEIANYIIQLMD